MDKLNQPVLILNTTYVPISIRSVKDAICMVLLEKAQIIRSSVDDFIRSEKLSIPVPHIILLSNYYSVPKKSIRLNRNSILERDSYTCVYCGKKPAPSKLTIDHIIPRSRWTEVQADKKPKEFNSWENLVTACKECNTKKGNKLLSEIKWKSPDSFKLKPKNSMIMNINNSSIEKYGWSEYLNKGK
jgi:5-methylcytosine-specific restriction endonuclease McrA